MYITRSISPIFKQALTTFPAILLTGPRQSGKTTFLRKELNSSHRYVSLENPDIRRQILSDPNGFFKIFSPPLILDEVQLVAEIFPYIKSLIDENRKPGQWILTGSQNFGLMQNITESLAGRVAILSLLPLSTSEILKHPASDSFIKFTDEHIPSVPAAPQLSLEQRILRGSYPEACLNLNVNRDLWYQSYLQTYLERDVRQALNVSDLNSFQVFLKLLASRTGSILNLSHLANDVGVSAPTIKRWLSVLEASYQIYLLHPYYNNFGKRLIKSPKVYFLDTGLVTSLLGIQSPETLFLSPFYGPLMETLIVSELVKTFTHTGQSPRLYFWRTSDGHEVDVLYEKDLHLYPVEIKGSSTLSPHDSRNLDTWRRLSGRQERGLVIGNISQITSLGQHNRGLPWFCI